MNVQRWNTDVDGPLTETGLINKLEQMGYRCTRYTYPKGTFFPDHSHDVDKIDAVLKGQFRINMGGENVTLKSGDYAFVSRGEIHSAEVIGDEAVVSIDAVRQK